MEFKYEVDGVEYKMLIDCEIDCNTFEIWDGAEQNWRAFILSEDQKMILIKFLQTSVGK